MRAPALLLAVAALAIAPRASAVELTWESPAGCPDRPNVEQRIVKLVGPAAKAEVLVEGRVTVTKTGYHLALTTTREGARGERALDDASCEALADSAALIVAMAIDPAAALAIEEPAEPVAVVASADPIESEPPPPSPAVVVAPPPADVPAIVVRAPERAASVRPRFLLGGGGEVLGGVFPRAALGAALSAGVLFGPFRVDVGGRFTPSSAHSLSAPSGASGTFELLVAQARGAYLFTRNAWDLGPTRGVEVGRARGRGHGVSESLEGRAPWFAGSLGALATLRAGAVAFTIDAALVVPFTRPSFVIEGAGTVHTPAALALRAGLSAEVRF
jgi:membrane-associated protease RseP (regulator of RpoE activity)